MEIRGHEKSAGEIRKELKGSHLFEVSAQKIGNQVKTHAQS